MGKHIQIRDVDIDTHEALKTKAAEAGLSLSRYLKRLIEKDAKTPSWTEIRRRIEAMTPIELKTSVSDILREERDARGDHLESLHDRH